MKKITLLFICLISFTVFGQAEYINIGQYFAPGVGIVEIDVPGYGTAVDIIISSDGSALTIIGEVGSTEILGNGCCAMKYDYDPLATISSSNETGGIEFLTHLLLMTDSSGANGNWANVISPAYIGFRIVDGSGYHYGRVEISTDLSVGIQWTVYLVGYNQTLDASITLGLGVLSSNENPLFDEVLILSDNDEIAIKNLPEETTYSLYSGLGQEIKKGSATKNSYAFDISNLSKGMYVLKVKGIESGKSLTRKIIL